MTNIEKNIILETNNLSIGYQQKKEQIFVLEDINIQFQKAKLIGVLGKNGIGKSTFLRTLSKVQKPLLGDILINNKNLDTTSHKELASQISVVLTERLPESQLTVFEIVALGRQPYTNWIDTLSAIDLEKINWAIEQTEITNLQHKRFYELSDGQLQRVLIARALAQDTEIIILDEPTAHLDMHHTIKIFSLLKKLVNQTQKTIVISSHEINLSIKLMDQILLLKENNYQFGTPNELADISAFEDLFPNNWVNFDKDLQQFIIKSEN